MFSVKLWIPLILLIASVLLVAFLTKKFKLNKNQITIFVVLLCFWTSITIIRSYRKLFAVTSIAEGGLGLSLVQAAQIAAAYGLMSTIIRLPMFVTSDIFRKRKIFIQLSLIISGVAALFVFLFPSYSTMYYSSLTIGITASMLAMFNVIFADTFDKEQAVVSTSILTVAPLMSEFISAPIQYFFTSSVPNNFAALWCVSAIFALATFVLSFFIRENTQVQTKFSFTKVKLVLSNKSFLVVSFLAVLISFTRFATSGANMVQMGKLVYGMSPFMLAYLDTVFVAAQIIGGVAAGIYFAKYLGMKNTLITYFVISIIFYIIALFASNPNVIFVTYALNGFAFGGLYNLIVSYAMQDFDKEYRNISMGISQLFFALGIYFGDSVYIWINNLLPNGLFGFYQLKSIFIITSFVALFSILLVTLGVYSDKKKLVSC
ncbi:MFS transporter [Actinomyces sp. zg-332]|uniref:MFS transporter n=1 Tax=Actinomyces sp. zg-332 TaxID=2708340 RepID=UPI00141DBECC|nr:MFS transporter [Actinomyces sp. zg-332]QPK93843.1 MFS transporter [Actinomyces sp. zg-332]